MAKSTKKVIPKKRGRPATGKDPMLSARVPEALIGEIEAWADAHDTTRSNAIRQLIERGLKK